MHNRQIVKGPRQSGIARSPTAAQTALDAATVCSEQIEADLALFSEVTRSRARNSHEHGAPSLKVTSRSNRQGSAARTSAERVSHNVPCR